MSGAFPSAAEIAAGVRDGRLSPVRVVQAALDRIAALDPGLNCFTGLRAEEALAEAQALDAGDCRKPLAGVPFAVKNLFDVQGVTTLAGSALLAGRPPAQRDAAMVERLRAAGAILIGQLNMDEFAYGFSTENAHHGITANPHDPGRIAGGSSGGSAASVAAGLVPLALGSDTNGSIRVPASLCGVFGLKPSFGRLSRRGAFPFVHSLDHVGPFARSVADLALCYDAMQGPDAEDPALVDRAAEPVSPALDAPLRPLRVGVLGGWFRHGADAQALSAVQRVADGLARAGASVREASLNGAEAARSAAFCITAAEGGALHLPTLRTDADRYDPAVRDRLIAGAMLPAAVTARAQRVRAVFRAEAAAVLEHFDILLAPATPCAAVPRGAATMLLDGQQVPARANLGLHTQPISFIGLPVLSVPAQSETDALPIGVQLIGAPWAERTLFEAAFRLERDGVSVCRAPGALS
ncbi:AtzE family amidohydrolase [Acetobacteraceae bacterium KSS8]|uniref:AtzE family amidohydrolase n=1 Tax=Endosaccharibacter trunci TaxID=2812733 RepID=A0ABT1W4W1_9PROT|nr:AtzE family amidohydrolase [Acetobacteraceae bacterium KSS8]